ncbi:MAG: MBOAT family protein [Eubacteriales bacterium]|nr:MBOAT family protein [Eubacteriales bacterium]MDD3198363.1 MBOAT family protein [Eubacteriales bacterium]MDD3504004.1 MBOAT family protein [Eubacteriales bacterium]MDD4683211.1 MBOAT family protein [Eubacteriales bacterium]
MVFSSASFLFFFLPVVLIIYYLTPQGGRNLVLLAASLLFYAWGEPVYVIIMILSSISGYIHGLLIEKYQEKRIVVIILISSIFFSAGALIWFKYIDFLLFSFNQAFGSNFDLLHLALPIGISFYTFQIISYTVDVYRRDVPAQRDFIKFSTYITFFPQLIAGPIVRYRDIALQIDNRPGHSFKSLAGQTFYQTDNLITSLSIGIERFAIGLAKKVLLANNFGRLAELMKNTHESSMLSFWLLAASGMLQIYFDFSGYSDMAIGLGRMFGFKFDENFNYPLIAVGIRDFWRRWHISLGSWFRDYIYIPLGGSRCNLIKFSRNIIIVWLLTGLWHGAQWNFVMWGLYFALLLMGERFLSYTGINPPVALKHFFTLILITISFNIFQAENAAEAIYAIKNMLPGSGLALVDTEALYYLRSYSLLIVIGTIAATPLPKKIVCKCLSFSESENMSERKCVLTGGLNILKPIFIMALLCFATAGIVDSSFNPFIYFRF